MRFNLRKTISLSLTVLIISSTVGFNILLTFCGGCDKEHIAISLVADDSNSCSCCDEDGHEKCCSLPIDHCSGTHHETRHFIAQLKYDSLEVKTKLLKVLLPVVPVYFVAIIFDLYESFTQSVTHSIVKSIPPSGGRSILLSICVLRH
ncbi:MAG TPA: hypothetical protein PKV50_09240 [Prolixibacteraceae bacterium]|nr:hypothetical protein [Prolixibacteraceae bacterium]